MSNVPIRAYIRGGGGGGEGGGDEEIKQLAGGIFSVPPPVSVAVFCHVHRVEGSWH